MQRNYSTKITKLTKAKAFGSLNCNVLEVIIIYIINFEHKMNQYKIKYTTILKIFILLLVSVAFLNPFFIDNDLYDSTRTGKIIFFLKFLILLVPIGITVFVKNKDFVGTLSVVMLLWLTWTVIRGKNGGIWYDEKFLWWSGCFVFYFITEQVFRFVEKKDFYLIHIPIFLISIVAGAQSIIGLLQVYGKFDIFHVVFKVTGTFFNPAPYSGFLIASLPFALFLSSLKTKKYPLKIFSIIGYLSVCLIFSILPVTKSRAAYLGCISVMIIWCFYRYRPLIILRTILDTRLKQILTYIIGPILIVTILSGLYFFKKDSANGRLLIWKVAYETIKKKPIIGNGFNSIQATLAPAQASYFATGHGTESEKMLAGSVKWAFNEYIQITSEIGLIGLMLMLLVVVFALATKYKGINPEHCLLIGACKANVVGILVFGCFSYPFYSLPITLLFFTSLAFISSQNKGCSVRYKLFIYSFKRIVIFGMLIFGVFYMIQLPKIEKGYWLWDEANKMCKIQAYIEANESFLKADSLLPNNGLLMQQYGKSLYMQEEYVKGITTLKKSGHFYKDQFWYISMGDCYVKTGDFNLAEENYQMASQMIPHKFYSEYLLAKLYDKFGYKEKAVIKAKSLLSKKIKVESRAIDEIKYEMKSIINKY